MERRWLISAMAAMAMVATPALAEDKEAETAPPTAPGVQVAEAPAAPAAPTAPEVVQSEEEKKDGTQAPVDADKAKTDKPVVLAQGAAPPPPTTGENPSADKAPEDPAPPKFTYGAYGDFYFSTNFNNPVPPINGLAAYDFKDEHGPHLNYAEVWAEYARDPIGFRLDVGWGPGGRVTNFFERTISRDDIWDHVQQAYVGVNLHKNGNTWLDFGRWVTPVGAEVIDSKDNWAYSRGLLFTWSGPFTHFGARVTHKLNDSDYILAHVTTGWDRVSFFQDAGPGFGITGSKKINDKLTLTGSYIGGEEPDAQDGGTSYRNFFDVVAAYNASTKWAYTANVEVGEQSGALWYGLSAQAKYALNGKSYLAARGEFLSDPDGVRFGTDGTAGGLTLTYGYTWNKYFQTRVEYRHDFFDDDFFQDGRTGVTDTQGRFIIAAIVSY